jgi:hypothetical protein
MGAPAVSVANLWAVMAALVAKAQDPYAMGPSCYGFGGRRVPGQRRPHGLLDVCPFIPCPVGSALVFPHAASCMCVHRRLCFVRPGACSRSGSWSRCICLFLFLKFFFLSCPQKQTSLGAAPRYINIPASKILYNLPIQGVFCVYSN